MIAYPPIHWDWDEISTRIPVLTPVRSTRLCYHTDNKTGERNLIVPDQRGIVIRHGHEGPIWGRSPVITWRNAIVVQFFSLRREWWIRPRELEYFLNDRWCTFGHVMGIQD